MRQYRVQLGSEVAETVRRLPPGIKRALRAAIRHLAMNSTAGDALHGELEGRFKYRVRRYRIVYRIDRSARVLHIIAVDHRRSVYEDLAGRPDSRS